MRFIKNGNIIIDYLSDSSYFIYIAHLPVVLLFQRSVHFQDNTAIGKWLMVCFFSYGSLFFIYHFFVRFSPIGTFLHGKKEFFPVMFKNFEEIEEYKEIKCV